MQQSGSNHSRSCFIEDTFTAISNVFNHTDSPDKLTGDTEIQNWAKELSEVANFKVIISFPTLTYTMIIVKDHFYK